jgi:LDH2 family malate/lactate/ureidoglycolate dehydrogenase
MAAAALFSIETSMTYAAHRDSTSSTQRVHKLVRGMSAVLVPADRAGAFAVRLLEAHGVPSADAEVVARCLVRADLRGVDSHGVIRLPGYLHRLRLGLINPAPSLEPRRVTPAAASLDGENGFGFVIATRAMAEATALAASTGIGAVSVRRSTHFGMAACYALQAIEAGFIGLIFTNASPGMPPWGGRDPLIGTSPIAVGIPAGREVPFVLDMSPAIAARGKIRRAARDGVDIPLGWALDADGRATTDPNAALGGVMQPIGGPKGSALSLMMDVFGGVISGAAFAGQVGDMTKEFGRPQDVGHFFLALRPDLFLPLDQFHERMDGLVSTIHGARRAEGFEEILMPGELEGRRERTRRVEGIPYDVNDIEPLQQEAEKAGVEPLVLD